MTVFRWIVSNLVEGFFILLPFLIAYLLLGQLFDALLALTQPVVDLLPKWIFPEQWVHQLCAAAILLLIFVLVAIAAKSAPARRLGRWIEDRVLNPFPPYAIMKKLTRWFTGSDVPKDFRPGLLTVASGRRQVVAIVEELPGDKLTVFVPRPPTPAVGELMIVDRALVEPLDVPLGDALAWVLNWGAGTEKLFPAQVKDGRAGGAADAPA